MDIAHAGQYSESWGRASTTRTPSLCVLRYVKLTMHCELMNVRHGRDVELQRYTIGGDSSDHVELKLVCRYVTVLDCNTVFCGARKRST